MPNNVIGNTPQCVTPGQRVLRPPSYFKACGHEPGHVCEMLLSVFSPSPQRNVVANKLQYALLFRSVHGLCHWCCAAVLKMNATRELRACRCPLGSIRLVCALLSIVMGSRSLCSDNRITNPLLLISLGLLTGGFTIINKWGVFLIHRVTGVVPHRAV